MPPSPSLPLSPSLSPPPFLCTILEAFLFPFPLSLPLALGTKMMIKGEEREWEGKESRREKKGTSTPFSSLLLSSEYKCSLLFLISPLPLLSSSTPKRKVWPRLLAARGVEDSFFVLIILVLQVCGSFLRDIVIICICFALGRGNRLTLCGQESRKRSSLFFSSFLPDRP